MQSPPFDLEVTDGLLSTTRAVRKRLDFDRPVEPDVVKECLRLAIQAPTGSNLQLWRWIVVTDATLRERIADAYRVTALPYLRAGLAERAASNQGRVRDSALYLAHNLERAPMHVIPCYRTPIDLSSNASAAGAYGSIMPAIWSFQLALRARGLGSTWTTLHLGEEAAVADLLGIPDGITQVALLPVAYTRGVDFKPAPRRPVEDVTYWNRWGEKQPPAGSERPQTGQRTPLIQESRNDESPACAGLSAG